MRVFNYIILICVLMILFFLAGFNTSIGFVLGTLNLAESPESLLTDQTGETGITQSTANLYSTILLILIGASIVGIIIGSITRTPPENYLVLPLAILLLSFVGDMIFIILQIKAECGSLASSCNWVSWVVIIIVAPLTVGYLLSVIDWWRGRD